MDRDLLEGWLEQGLSLNEISALTDRDPSTVGYWVAKYGLIANGKAKYAPRGALTRDQLEPLVERGATVREMAQELDRSPSTIRHWLSKHGLKLTRHHRNRDRALEALEAGRTRFTSTCRYHGETEFLVFRSGRHRCARCNTEAVVRRRRRVKQTLVDEAGGRCVRCGFDEHPAALQFHHLDPSEKEFSAAARA
ncbi:MAG TPA: helix-turn-helix domain-containing protein [Solirubrobacterales bacterium]